jgi:hypothetical protein
MNPEENPLIKKALNENVNSQDEIKKIDAELEECRVKLSNKGVELDAKQVVKRRIDDLLDKRLVWMGSKIVKKQKSPLNNNEKKIIRLMRRKTK